jgi:hypothetical protein
MRKKEKLKVKCIEYPLNDITKRVPPEFLGIASRYASIKKERLHSEHLFDTCFQQLRYIQKVNKTLEKSLEHKKVELHQAETTHNRYTMDIMQV